jgi:hypothetical protein
MLDDTTVGQQSAPHQEVDEEELLALAMPSQDEVHAASRPSPA